MKKVIGRFVMLIMALLLTCGMAMAQSSGDKLYNEGLRLQKTMTVSAQNSAIAKFNSAKKLYDSKAKKAQCDQAIQVSMNIKKSLSGGGRPSPYGGGQHDRIEHQGQRKEAHLSLSNSEFKLQSPSETSLNVVVTASSDDWDVDAVPNADGSSFLKVSKEGDGSFKINVPYNNGYSIRRQTVMASLDGLKREVKVIQPGRPVKIEASAQLLESKDKGEVKEVDIYCNSTERYSDNRGANWYVVSQPEWVDVVIDNSEDNIVQKTGKAISGLFKKKYKPSDPTLTPTHVNVHFRQLTFVDDAYRSGRKGEIVIGSGDQRFVITVIQNGKR